MPLALIHDHHFKGTACATKRRRFNINLGRVRIIADERAGGSVSMMRVSGRPGAYARSSAHASRRVQERAVRLVRVRSEPCAVVSCNAQVAVADAAHPPFSRPRLVLCYHGRCPGNLTLFRQPTAFCVRAHDFGIISSRSRLAPSSSKILSFSNLFPSLTPDLIQALHLFIPPLLFLLCSLRCFHHNINSGSFALPAKDSLAVSYRSRVSRKCHDRSYACMAVHRRIRFLCCITAALCHGQPTLRVGNAEGAIPRASVLASQMKSRHGRIVLQPVGVSPFGACETSRLPSFPPSLQSVCRYISRIGVPESNHFRNDVGENEERDEDYD